MQTNANIVLVGFMGTGKTTVGKILAQQLNMTFLDMDHIIEQRENRSIPDIFREDGEPHFRLLEKALAGELSKLNGLVIATGGGIVLDPENIQDYSKTGMVICLKCEPETILERVERDENRPLLSGEDKRSKIVSLLDSRRSAYDAIPCRIDTTNLTPEQVAEKIIALRG